MSWQTLPPELMRHIGSHTGSYVKQLSQVNRQQEELFDENYIENQERKVEKTLLAQLKVLEGLDNEQLMTPEYQSFVQRATGMRFHTRDLGKIISRAQRAIVPRVDTLVIKANFRSQLTKSYVTYKEDMRGRDSMNLDELYHTFLTDIVPCETRSDGAIIRDVKIKRQGTMLKIYMEF